MIVRTGHMNMVQIKVLNNGTKKKISCQSGVLPVLSEVMLSKIPTFRSGIGLRIKPQEKMN